MSTSPPQPTPDRLDPPPSIRWQCWPLRDEPLRTALLMVGLAVGAMVARWASGKTHLALLVVLALMLALWRFFVPIAYEINTRGVERRLFGRRRRIPWVSIRRYRIAADGVILLPRKEQRPADALQATYLPWASRREEVLQQLRYYLGPPK